MNLVKNNLILLLFKNIYVCVCIKKFCSLIERRKFKYERSSCTILGHSTRNARSVNRSISWALL